MFPGKMAKIHKVCFRYESNVVFREMFLSFLKCIFLNVILFGPSGPLYIG